VRWQETSYDEVDHAQCRPHLSSGRAQPRGRPLRPGLSDRRGRDRRRLSGLRQEAPSLEGGQAADARVQPPQVHVPAAGGRGAHHGAARAPEPGAGLRRGLHGRGALPRDGARERRHAASLDRAARTHAGPAGGRGHPAGAARARHGARERGGAPGREAAQRARHAERHLQAHGLRHRVQRVRAEGPHAQDAGHARLLGPRAAGRSVVRGRTRRHLLGGRAAVASVHRPRRDRGSLPRGAGALPAVQHRRDAAPRDPGLHRARPRTPLRIRRAGLPGAAGSAPCAPSRAGHHA
jgi:hypothetical protein